jgi:hypothetical protein
LRPGIVPPGFFLLWPYLLAAFGALLWLALRRKAIARKLEYLIVAFVACSLANIAIDEACSFVVPVDIAGTVPPDPRNAALRALITAAVQLPVTLVLGYWIAFPRSSARKQNNGRRKSPGRP